jgi:hypothetical protein
MSPDLDKVDSEFRIDPFSWIKFTALARGREPESILRGVAVRIEEISCRQYYL